MPVSSTKEELAKIRGGTCVSPSDMGAEVAQDKVRAALLRVEVPWVLLALRSEAQLDVAGGLARAKKTQALETF